VGVSVPVGGGVSVDAGVSAGAGASVGEEGSSLNIGSSLAEGSSLGLSSISVESGKGDEEIVFPGLQAARVIRVIQIANTKQRHFLKFDCIRRILIYSYSPLNRVLIA
jgi:hypothetical protein